MPRLIDADRVKSVIDRHKHEMTDGRQTPAREIYAMSCEHIVELLDLIPTVEAEPIRYAYWIPDDYEYYHCSDCGYEQDEREKVTRRCPNCGAHMDEPEAES